MGREEGKVLWVTARIRTWHNWVQMVMEREGSRGKSLNAGKVESEVLQKCSGKPGLDTELAGELAAEVRVRRAGGKDSWRSGGREIREKPREASWRPSNVMGAGKLRMECGHGVCRYRIYPAFGQRRATVTQQMEAEEQRW